MSHNGGEDRLGNGYYTVATAPNSTRPANANQSARGVLATLSMPSHIWFGIVSAESIGVM